MSRPEGKCVHVNFAIQANVARIFDRPEDEARSEVLQAENHSIDLSIECADCGKKFMFVGAPIGVDPGKPTMSVDQLELRIPVFPEGEMPKIIGPGFTIKPGAVLAKPGTDELLGDLGIRVKHGKRKLPPGVN